MITLEINDLKTSVEEGTTILEAAQSLGFPIPTLCHMEGLFPYGLDDGISNECWDFMEAVAEGRPPEIDAATGLKAKSVCFALYESMTLGRPVKLADVASGKVDAYQRPIDEYWGI